MRKQTNGELVRQYLESMSASQPTDRVSSFLAPEAVFREFPNRIAPEGRVRDAAAALRAVEQGQKMLRSQSYEVHRLIEAGDEVAVEIEWTGTLAIPFEGLTPGTQLKAYVGMFIACERGRVVSQTNYDCYPPLGQTACDELVKK